ncbi:hypothetical protein Ancab_002289, partial [Ancistrocladus abbreviatus]
MTAEQHQIRRKVQLQLELFVGRFNQIEDAQNFFQTAVQTEHVTAKRSNGGIDVPGF